MIYDNENYKIYFKGMVLNGWKPYEEISIMLSRIQAAFERRNARRESEEDQKKKKKEDSDDKRNGGGSSYNTTTRV